MQWSKHAQSHGEATDTPFPYIGHKGQPVLICDHRPDQEGVLDRVACLTFLENVGGLDSALDQKPPCEVV